MIQEKQKHMEERQNSRKQTTVNDSGNDASSEDSNDSLKSIPIKGLI
jgi:hypothetical protein